MDQSGVREKKSIALSSVIAGLGLTGMKLIVGLSTNSLGILSEAAHSGLDLLAALITLIAVNVSDKPADKDHQYGHGKMENISALFETLLLIVTCGWIIWEGVGRLVTRSTHVDVTIWSYGVIAVSIVVDFSRSRALKRVAKKYGSQALEADRAPLFERYLDVVDRPRGFGVRVIRLYQSRCGRGTGRCGDGANGELPARSSNNRCVDGSRPRGAG